MRLQTIDTLKEMRSKRRMMLLFLCRSRREPPASWRCSDGRGGGLVADTADAVFVAGK
jgi:hypothetical protein